MIRRFVLSLSLFAFAPQTCAAFGRGGWPGWEQTVRALGATFCVLTSEASGATTANDIIGGLTATADAGAIAGFPGNNPRGYGRAWGFSSAANSKLTVPDNAVFTQASGTILVWFRGDATHDSGIYAHDDCGNDGWGILWGAGNTIFLYNRGAPPLTYVGPAHDTDLHMIGAGWDTTTLDVWFDDTEETTNYPWRSPADAINQAEIGSELNGGCSANADDGQKMQYLTLFDRKLTYKEVLQAYYSVRPFKQ